MAIGDPPQLAFQRGCLIAVPNSGIGLESLCMRFQSGQRPATTKATSRLVFVCSARGNRRMRPNEKGERKREFYNEGKYFSLVSRRLYNKPTYNNRKC